MTKQLLIVAGLALGILACPSAFEPGNPPCDEDADCSVEVLGADFAGHICVDGSCYAEADAPVVDAGPDPLGGLYDAGPAVDSGEPECREDADCGDGNICSNQVCVPFQSGCSADDQCPDGEVCRDSECLLACEGHDGCAPNRGCVEGACIELIACGGEGDPECTGDLQCNEGLCSRPECYPGRDCAEGMVCVGGACEDP